MLLGAEGLTKRFGGVSALEDADFEVEAGEVVALVGDNGAGKSTLIKALSGAQPADAGTISIAAARSIRSPQDAHRLGIATVYQDLALADNLDVVANLYLGRGAASARLGRALDMLDEAEMEHRTRELLRHADGRHAARRPRAGRPASGGQRQRSRSPARCSASHGW